MNADAIPDRRLELMLVCAHPAIERAVRTPLMLNTGRFQIEAVLDQVSTRPGPDRGVK